MFLYPFLQESLLHFTDSQYGLFTGASIHEVAQAVVAGTNISAEAGSIAVIVKMTRVLLLIPVLLIISLIINTTNKTNHKKAITIPWFAIAFAGVIGFNSLQLIPMNFVTLINQFDTFLLTMAMAAIGMETNINKIKNVGFKPLYLAIILFIWLISSAFLMVKYWGSTV
jgi:uncharacterized integral membrane protein (TIGR00698 family)